MKRKTEETKKQYVNDIKEGEVTYKGLYVGMNKKGNIYLGLKKDEGEFDFISSYEMIHLLNTILEDADEITVAYSKEVSKAGNEYEVATPTDIKWCE